MHKEHKILELSDEKSFEKENITIESSTKDFNESNKSRLNSLSPKELSVAILVKSSIFTSDAFSSFNFSRKLLFLKF